MAGTDIKVAADGGALDAYIAAPAQGKGPGVILVTHIYGVDRDTRGMCDMLADKGCVALAQNFLARQGFGRARPFRRSARARPRDAHRLRPIDE